MTEHPYGWLSLLPPVVAILFAIATRRVVVSLVLGIFVGALVTTQGNIFRAIYDTWELHLWNALVTPGKLRVFSFTLMMGAMIGVITRSGGMRGLIELVAPWANTRRRGQLATWFLGLLIFFDDYANTILLGSTLRPICDRLKISREKLAYLVDSTAAPVAGLALVSTWVAVEIEYVQSGLENLDSDHGLSAFNLFVASIPYRFYILSSLFFVFLVSISGRDFGSMLSAESDCVTRDSPPDQLGIDTDTHQGLVSGSYNAILPILVTLGIVVWQIVQTGWDAIGTGARGDDLRIWDIVGAGDSTLALQYGALIGLGVAAAMAWSQRLLTGAQIVDAALAGARVVLPAIAILWCAGAVSTMTGNKSSSGEPTTTPYEYRAYRLYTGDYLKQVLVEQFSDGEETPSDTVPTSVKFLPTVVFILAAAVAFCTGTSWGTMGILLPMVVSLAYALLSKGTGTVPGNDPIFVSSIGGVLAGAVFGDHCSPLSDTTVLSSQSSGCDHIAHVWTQLPYALVAAAVSVFCGTLPLGWGVSVWTLLPIQLLALSGVLLFLGRKAEDFKR